MAISEDRDLYIDVSSISLVDHGTGIQRVVRAQLKELLKNPPKKLKIKPIRFNGKDNWIPKYANTYVNNLLGKTLYPEKDETVIFKENSIYYCPDLSFSAVFYADKKGYFQLMKEKNIKIIFTIYDLIPLEYPEYASNPIFVERFADWLKTVLKYADLLICISKTTAESLRRVSKKVLNIKKLPPIEILYLGADFLSAKTNLTFSYENLCSLLLFKPDKVIRSLKPKSYFLMVSVLEPKKGHYQVIKAMELLWNKGLEVNLVLVGKKGWKVNNLIQYIENHPYKDKRLFWLGFVPDNLLKYLYENALATIIASEVEGFGLPLIESAYHGTPIIARDIPVFKEIAGEKAFYFPNTENPKDLANSLIDWLNLYKKGKHPKPQGIKWLSWKEHTERLKQIFENLI